MKPFLQHKLVLYCLFPLLFYFLFFALYTWPWLPNFSTHFFSDAGDGLQNVWNLWWTQKALTGPDSLWFTSYLHIPHGSTLLGHTLSPINGIIGTGLQTFLSPVHTYNLLVIFAFIGTGLTTFWLSYAISKSYWGSLLAGFAFTFSSYHFGHGIGHLNLITLQYVPLFLLAWLTFLKKPSYLYALLSALALALVMLSDFYYLLFCIIAAAIMVAFMVRKIVWGPHLLFLALTLLFIAPLPIAIILQNTSDPFLGFHDPKAYGTDLFAPFIPNEIWRFNHLTDWFWQFDHLDRVEGSVNLGVALLGTVIAAIVLRKKLPTGTMMWFWIGLIFAVLSFGPRLHILGNTVDSIPLPYAVLTKILPPLKLAGVSVRMMVMAILSAALLLPLVLSQFSFKKTASRVALAGLCLILLLESWPAPLPLTPVAVPDFAAKLKDMPPGGVVDQFSTRTGALYAQTIHEHPLIGGYLSRIPTSVDQKDQAVLSLLAAENYSELNSNFSVTYIVKSDGTLYQIIPGQNDLFRVE